MSDLSTLPPAAPTVLNALAGLDSQGLPPAPQPAFYEEVITQVSPLRTRPLDATSDAECDTTDALTGAARDDHVIVLDRGMGSRIAIALINPKTGLIKYGSEFDARYAPITHRHVLPSIEYPQFTDVYTISDVKTQTLIDELQRWVIKFYLAWNEKAI